MWSCMDLRLYNRLLSCSTTMTLYRRICARSSYKSWVAARTDEIAELQPSTLASSMLQSVLSVHFE